MKIGGQASLVVVIALAGIEALLGLAEADDGCGIKEKLGEMIPEYSAQDSECVF